MKGPAPADAWFLIVRRRTDGKPEIQVMRELPRFSPITGVAAVCRVSAASVAFNSIDELVAEILDGTLPLWAHDAKG